MTDIALQPLAVSPGRFAKWTRIVAVTFAVIALLALSFALGRVTMEHTGHSTTILRPTVVQPVNTPAAHLAPVCHLHGPC
jgi:hypothetical protein